jgi:geranylgeranyl pyrophosphate synthase
MIQQAAGDTAQGTPTAAADEGAGRVGSFVDRVSPRIDAAIDGAVAGLGQELGGMDRVIARAVGTEGMRGRRWRPLLGVAAAVAGGGRVDDALPLAVAVELTHTASLVLDDLPCMDDSPQRRGLTATHREVGTAGALLVCIGLLGRAAELVARSPHAAAELGSQWGRTIGLLGMSGGQAMDLAAVSPLKGAARRLHRQKTVALCVLAVEGAARASGRSPAACAALAGYATDLGWAYQLVDDAADLAQDKGAGRPPGGRSPLRQSERLLLRAERRLRHSGALGDAGVRLMAELGRWVAATPMAATLAPAMAPTTPAALNGDGTRQAC